MQDMLVLCQQWFRNNSGHVEIVCQFDISIFRICLTRLQTTVKPWHNRMITTSQQVILLEFTLDKTKCSINLRLVKSRQVPYLPRPAMQCTATQLVGSVVKRDRRTSNQSTTTLSGGGVPSSNGKSYTCTDTDQRHSWHQHQPISAQQNKISSELPPSWMISRSSQHCPFSTSANSWFNVGWYGLKVN